MIFRLFPYPGRLRAVAALLAGCVQRVFFPQVAEATIRVLSAEGCEVLVPRGQGCCGALSIHAGREEEALAFARDTIALFEEQPVDAILVNAAGCGSNMKDYGRLLANDPNWAARAAAFSAKVRDVNEFLAALPPAAPRHTVRARVAYHDSCHLAHAQRIREQPRRLLAGIPGLELVEIPDGDQCCGSAGIYNLVQPEGSEEIGARKADNVLSVKPDLLLRQSRLHSPDPEDPPPARRDSPRRPPHGNPRRVPVRPPAPVTRQPARAVPFYFFLSRP